MRIREIYGFDLERNEYQLRGDVFIIDNDGQKKQLTAWAYVGNPIEENHKLNILNERKRIAGLLKESIEKYGVKEKDITCPPLPIGSNGMYIDV